jgi:hypothetical protein
VDCGYRRGSYPQAVCSAIAGVPGLAPFWGAVPVCGDRGGSGHAHRRVRRRWQFAQAVRFCAPIQPVNHSCIHRPNWPLNHRSRCAAGRETTGPQRRRQAAHLRRRPRLCQLLLQCARLEYGDNRSVPRARDQLVVMSGVWASDQRPRHLAGGRRVRQGWSNISCVGKVGHRHIQSPVRFCRAGRCR